MRNCPICQVVLEACEYENQRLLRCPQCKGHLVPRMRLEGIKRLADKNQTELKAEAAEGFHGDHTERIRCPRCHAEMKKEPLRIPVMDLKMDVCRDCELVWLDGGELALLQLAFESSPRGMDAQKFKQRLSEIEASPERKAAFEANLARLPSGELEDDLLKSFAEAYLSGDGLGRLWKRWS